METENYPIFPFIFHHFWWIVLILLCYFNYFLLFETKTKSDNHEDEKDEEDEGEKNLRTKIASEMERFAKISKRRQKLISDKVGLYELLITIEAIGKEAEIIDGVNEKIKELKNQKEEVLNIFLSVIPTLKNSGTLEEETLEELSLAIMKIESLHHVVENKLPENHKKCKSIEELTVLLKDVSEKNWKQFPKKNIDNLIINISDTVDQISYVKTKWTEITDLLIKS